MRPLGDTTFSDSTARQLVKRPGAAAAKQRCSLNVTAPVRCKIEGINALAQQQGNDDDIVAGQDHPRRIEISPDEKIKQSV